MPDSYVTKAEIEHNEIVLYVNAGAFDSGEYVEISGCATQATKNKQSNGGFATFSEIQEVKKPELEIRAKFTKEFQDGLDITVFVRVAKVWITVLSQGVASSEEPGSRQPWEAAGVGGPDDYSADQGTDG